MVKPSQLATPRSAMGAGLPATHLNQVKTFQIHPFRQKLPSLIYALVEINKSAFRLFLKGAACFVHMRRDTSALRHFQDTPVARRTS